MAITNKGELKTAIADYLHRSDISATAMDAFIMAAEAEFNRELRVGQMETRATTTMTDQWTQLPDDFLKIRLIRTTDDKLMEYVTPEGLARLIEAHAAPAAPYYSVADMQLWIYPYPTVAAPLEVEIIYYAKIDSLVNDADTNWLLTQYPDAYLYGSLMAANDYIKDDERSIKWGARLTKAMEGLKSQGETIRGGSPTLAIRVA